MKDRYFKFKVFIYGLFMCAVVAWIFLNPYSDIYSLKNISYVANNVNNFFSSLKLGYKLVLADISNILRFTEYMTFGIINAVIFKFYSKYIARDIFIPLFLGLLISVLEVYYRFLHGSIISIDIVILSFIEFCAGLFLYILFNRSRNTSKSGYKFKISR